jgi:hypothetical protein
MLNLCIINNHTSVPAGALSSSAFAPFQFPLSKSQIGHTTSFVHITADVPITMPSNFSPTIILAMAFWMS